MKMKKVGLIKLFVISLLVLLFVSACTSNNNSPKASEQTSTQAPALASGETAAPKKELPPVQLTYYFPQGELQKDTASVEEAINQYIKPKINATIKLMPIVFADYEQKMNTAVAANEQFDILFTTSWIFNYENNAEKGAFMDLGELLPKYAPEFMKSLPPFVIDGSKTSKGKLYAIPNYQVAAKQAGFIIEKEFIDKYKLDVSKLKTIEDLEPFLEQIKKNEPDKIPYLSRPNTFMAISNGYAGTQEGYYKKGDPNYQLIQMETTPEYMAHLKLLHEWFKKGYTPKDVATLTLDEGATMRSGKVVSLFDWTLKPGGEAEFMSQNGGHPVVFIPTTAAEFSGVQATMTAISRTSKNPERAMMFLNLVNTDSQLFNLLAFGVEGKHYDKKGPNTIAIKKDGGYSSDAAWVMGNVTIGYLKEGQPEDTWKKTIELNNTAFVPDIFGFSLDTSSVKTELANMDAVYKEYDAAVKTGTVDPAVYLPKMVDALKKAGSEKVLKEKQKQLDAWLVSHGKKK